MIFPRCGTVPMTFRIPPNYRGFLKSRWKTALIFERTQLMDSIYFSGAREQPRERQTRWTPLSTLPGTTSDTPTLTTLTGRALRSARVHLRPGLPASTHRRGISCVRGVRGKCPVRMKGEGAGVSREHPHTMMWLTPGKDGDLAGRASDHPAALRKSPPGRQEAPRAELAVWRPRSGRDATALLHSLWGSVDTWWLSDGAAGTRAP